MKKLILRIQQAPGDALMLSAAIRDLHRHYRGQFLTDVRSPYPELWENNPNISPLSEDDHEVEVIECRYPLIHRSNQTPYHFIHGIIEFLNSHLDLQISPTEFKGDIHLSEEEKTSLSPVEQRFGQAIPYWIIAAGGKRDFTIKWWDTRRYQEVVNHFGGRIQFVQVGAAGHFHPLLDGVIDLRGKTSLRYLLRLMYHADGVVCPVTFLMHLAAAVETKGEQGLRPCVVIAGGREPVHWEHYPGHQLLHTIGMLPCCKAGGCWKSRTVPLGDGSHYDQPKNLCTDVVNALPRCMDMIKSGDVIRHIEMYLEAGKYWSRSDKNEHALRLAGTNQLRDEDYHRFTVKKAQVAAKRFIDAIPPYSAAYVGRGIIICAGGMQYFSNAWVCVKMLRHLGCLLPIQFWHLGEEEIDKTMESWIKPLKVECVNALELHERFPVRRLKGWELKPYAILHCPFKEVLYLDADNVPVLDPEYLFETKEYQHTGAIFWPDLDRLGPDKSIWKVCEVEFRSEPEFETGQLLVNKEKCWPALTLCMWYNEHSDFFYEYIHGDKETFHMAFRRLNQPYLMPGPVDFIQGVTCQHDFEERRIFQHRSRAKWNLFSENKRINGLLYETECRSFLEELQKKWMRAYGLPTQPGVVGNNPRR